MPYYLHNFHADAQSHIVPCRFGLVALHGRFFADDGFGNLYECDTVTAIYSSTESLTGTCH